MKRLTFLWLAGVLACARVDWGPEKLGDGKTSSIVNRLELGRDVYATYCVGCHGEKGDGQGPAARFMDPRPRDFRLGRIKFAAVASGQTAREEDYLRILSHGLSGTAMPSFALLPEQEKMAVVAYLQTFYAGKPRKPGSPITLTGDPWAGDPAGGVAAGRLAYYTVAQCWSCHPAYEDPAAIQALHVEAGLEAPELRPDVFSSVIKDSDWGAPIRPPDFLHDRVKNGLAPADLARVIAAGVGGTAMPTWASALTPRQIWGLAYYVRSIALQRGTTAGRQLRAHLGGGS